MASYQPPPTYADVILVDPENKKPAKFNPIWLNWFLGLTQKLTPGGAGSGTVTDVSVITANGLAGSVANSATTPAITLSTTITGLLKGNGTAISAAASGTDYAPPTSGTSILYGNGSGGFSNVTIGTGVSFAAGTLSATGSGGTVTSVTGTAPVASSGGTTPAISLNTGYGDTLNPYASKTANYVLAAPNGSTGVPTFRALVAADIPTLSYVPYTGAASAVDLNAQSLTNISHLGVNTTTVPTILARFFGDNNSSSRIAVRGYSSDANSSSMRITKFRGAYATPQAPQSGDSLGKFELAGYGTTSSDGYPQVSFEGVATENWGAVARGAKTLIKVTPNTTTAQVTAVTIDQDKSVTFATTATATTFIGALTGTASGNVTSVTGTAPVVSSGGTTPAISMAAATTSVNGYLTSTDWTTFNGKQAALVSGTNIKTVNGTTLLGSGDLGTITYAYGGTGQTTVTTGDLLYGSASNVWSKLGIGTTGQILRVVSGAPAWGTDYVGTVTSVGGTGTVNGITLTGTVTSSGNLTLGGTLGSIANSQLTNSSITIGTTAISLGASSTSLAGLTQIGSAASTSLLFQSNATTNMTLDSTGSLGLKVTPSGSSAGAFTQLQIGGASGYSTFFGQSNDYACGLASGAYFNSSSQYVYASSTKAVSSMYLYNGSTTIQYAAAGTAGNTFTPTTIGVFSSTGLAVTGTLTSTGNASFSTSTGGVSTIGNATPSAWSTGNYKGIEIIGGASFIGFVGNAQTYMLSNLYGDGTNYRYITASGGGLYAIQGVSSGAHVWYSAPVGAAGAVATVTQIMSVEPSKSLSLQGAVPQTGTGITFPATQSASTDANTLDDYEEGTWTPTLLRDGGGQVVTYTAVGTYTKVGRLVTISGTVTISVVVLQGTGNWYFDNRPFTQAATYTASGSIGYSTAASVGGVYGAPSATYFYPTNAGALFATNMGTGVINFSLAYQV